MCKSLNCLIAPLSRCMTVLILALASFSLCGCTLLGWVGGAVPKPDVAAAYKGLKNQTVGVMVWADSGITIDHPTIELDLARAVQDKLTQAQAADVDDLKGVQWVRADVIARFQQDHPELEGEDVAVIAPKLPSLTRLIYVEITGFSLHPSDAVELWRGDVTCDVKVYEIKDKKAVMKWQEPGVEIAYPRKSTSEGVMGLDADEVYRNSVGEMSTALALRFFQHEADAK